MTSHEESVLAVLGAIAALLYLVVAREQARRQVSRSSKPALMGFIVWWSGLGALGLMGLFFTFGPDLAPYGLGVVSAVIYLFLAIIMVVMGGLVHYLLYLYTGREMTMYLAYGFYAFMMVFSIWFLQAHDPHIAAGHLDTDMDASVGYHLHTEPPAWASLFFGLGLVLPALAAAMAYALLFFRTHDVTARYRIAMVSVGLVVWMGFSAGSTIFRAIAEADQQSFAGRLVSQSIGVIAATLTLLAYRPPKWIQVKLGLRDLSEPALLVPGMRSELPRKPRVVPA